MEGRLPQQDSTVCIEIFMETLEVSMGTSDDVNSLATALGMKCCFISVIQLADSQGCLADVNDNSSSPWPMHCLRYIIQSSCK